VSTDSQGFLECLQILNVWEALGGGEVRYGRGRAFFRDGGGFSVSLHPSKNCWFDFARNQGGGMLRLIEVALNCDHKTALKWAADFAGVTLERWTREEQRDYARRRREVEAEGRELVAWREEMINALIAHRDLAFGLYHLDKRRILGGDYQTDAELGELMNECEAMELEYSRDDEALDLWRNTSWDHVLLMFRQRRQGG
jgi:hypothetical protein